MAVDLTLNGTGVSSISTGIGMLDHLLTALATHGELDLELTTVGDLHIDPHHTVEDTLSVLGRTLDLALGERRGIVRFASAAAPLDEAVASCTLDLGGRGYATVDLGFTGTLAGMESSLLVHALDSFSRHGRLNIHLTANGDDPHHLAEASFKALALALRRACEIDPRRGGRVPSTKGVL